MRLLLTQTWDGRPIPAVEQVSVVLSATSEHLIVTVAAPLYGDPPPAGPAGPCWALWEHEVVELLILGEDERYTELELGPHGHHLLLQLHGRRRIVERMLPLDYQVVISGPRWHGEARLPWGLLPPGAHRGNAFSIHGQGRARRHLAWTPLLGAAPDFHRLEGFPLLQLPRSA